MCGGSKSSSSQSTSTTNQDNRIANDGGGAVFSEVAGNVSVETLDPVTIEGAFNALTKQNADVFEFATSFFDTAISTTQEAVAGSFSQSADLTKELFEEKNNPGSNNFLTLALVGVAAWVLVAIFGD